MRLCLVHEASVMFEGEWLSTCPAQLQEHVGVKVMLSSVLVKRSVADYLLT